MENHPNTDNDNDYDNASDPVILLDGLAPSTWTATRPSSGEVNAVFLYSRHDERSTSTTAELESSLGDLVSCNRLLACSRINRYWMGPAFGTSTKDVPSDTQFLLVELRSKEEHAVVHDDNDAHNHDEDDHQQQYALVLPLLDSGFRANLYGGSSRSGMDVVYHAESGNASVDSSLGMRSLYVAVGDDPFRLLKRGFQHVAEETGTFATLDQKILPPNVDEFGWCTWDAFYSKVSPEGILQGMKALREAGVPPRTLILDDGWQQVSPSPPEWQDDDTNNDNTLSFNRIISFALVPVTNALYAMLDKLVGTLYEAFVRKAPHGSFGNRAWSLIAKSVLKGQLWNFYDTETDFNRQMSGFDPNHKFQENKNIMDGEETAGIGMKELVSELKDSLGVKRVYCWHALHGYWRGISPELGESVGINVTNVLPSPSTYLLGMEPQIAWDTVSLFGVGLLSTASDIGKFYKHLHTPLVEAGIDGVKVDVQSGVSAGGVDGGPHLARLYTEAMEASVSEHFTTPEGAVNCINCMCHSTENLYRHKFTSVARASDDFFPDRPNSHTVHLVNVVYNSIFMGEICLPDWDMFHSKHESAPLHAAARAVGGCPVYVSDAPGDHDAALLKRLVLPDGSTLRAQLPGRPTRDCLFVDVGTDGTSALKVWNQNLCGGGVVGAFHVQGVAWNFETHENEVVHPSPPPLTAVVKPHDVESLRNVEGPFAAWRHQSSTLELLPRGSTTMQKSLNHGKFEIFTIVPVQTSDNGVAWGPIGLADMYNSGGALVEAGQLEETTASTTSVQFKSRGPGRFVAFCQPAPTRVLIGGIELFADLLFSYDDRSGKLSFTLPEEESDGSPHKVTVVWNDPGFYP